MRRYCGKFSESDFNLTKSIESTNLLSFLLIVNAKTSTIRCVVAVVYLALRPSSHSEWLHGFSRRLSRCFAKERLNSDGGGYLHSLLNILGTQKPKTSTEATTRYGIKQPQWKIRNSRVRSCGFVVDTDGGSTSYSLLSYLEKRLFAPSLHVISNSRILPLALSPDSIITTEIPVILWLHLLRTDRENRTPSKLGLSWLRTEGFQFIKFTQRNTLGWSITDSLWSRNKWTGHGTLFVVLLPSKKRSRVYSKNDWELGDGNNPWYIRDRRPERRTRFDTGRGSSYTETT